MKLISPSLLVLGVVLNALAAFQLIPATLAMVLESGNHAAFFTSAAVTSAVGTTLAVIGNHYRTSNLQPRQMFLITASAWLVVPCFGALPLILHGDGLTFTDAVFESVSGMTTTGSTVFVGLAAMTADVLLWRSLLQWFGGMGIIGMAIAVLPFLSVGGMKLFRTESSDWSDKSLPRTQQLLKHMVYSYMVLTLLCALSYRGFGMGWFNAVNHAMSTISTGGYSTSDNSFSQFTSLPLHWIAIVFMIMGAIPFVLYIRFLRHRSLLVFADAQVRGMLAILATLAVVITGAVILERDLPFAQALTHATFNIVSVVTTTGYASADYMQWGSFVIAIFFFATFLGGCSGSTSGGIKTFRVQLCFTVIREQIAKAIHPRATLARRYNGNNVSDDIVTSLVGFLFVMALSLTILTLILAATGLDLVTSLTASATALMNVGPGLGDIVGPSGNFSTLSAVAKWVLCLGMIMGRLEFLTIIVLLSPAFWRR
ncbi:MAG: TrkH family potassium uptake protein [Gammaproteobacteria bacterium]|nr:TrkH family potassium uptake protein [Gammaproteobacteria bacterium]MDP2139914.1 TrkH family potassium uptake protein [Gammaproteobacteria bacterium]MDP2347734.1 TrkH family potassium uptake protein [Gammaproteobacteria bacterium]